MTVPEFLIRPLLAVFPDGGQHRSRRHAYLAVSLAEAHRRDRTTAALALAAVAAPASAGQLAAVR